MYKYMDGSHEIMTNLFKNYLVSSTEEKDLVDSAGAEKETAVTCGRFSGNVGTRERLWQNLWLIAPGKGN